MVVSLFLTGVTLAQSQHPSIMLTKRNLPELRKGIMQYPLLKKSYNSVKQTADKAIASPVNVPVPKDGGGGTTHEQHKKNYQNILACGMAYQVSQDPKYARYVQDILLNYASQYESWGLHSQKRTSNPAGRIFWQNLNDCVWQVYVILGYDLVHDFISKQNREQIEQQLFIPVIKFLSEDNKETFNRIHNHGTWSVAAVGMTGYVLSNKDWIEKALRGSDKDGNAGYLKQLNELFSPDGYYSEGPYYQRYALLPFVLFAKAIRQYQPELNIYKARNGVLKKAIHTALQLTYTNGAFFPINDAMKDKTFESEEMAYAVNIAYADMEAAPDLLDVAMRQDRVVISDAGLKVAKDVAAGKAKPFRYISTWFSDGSNGTEGGIGILRSGKNEDQQCVLLKASAQGMGHGHFDRLNLLYYDNGVEVFTDYGAARFLNIESKRGGEYLPENKTYANQTIAHNTLVVDEVSHYNGKLSDAEKKHPEQLYFNVKPGLQVISAKEGHAYEGVSLTRTILCITVDGLQKPLLVDVMKATSDRRHQYDLPFWYQGHLTNIPFKVTANTNDLKPLGKSNGYQHVWLNGTGGFSNKGSSFLTFLNNRRFYTTSFSTDSNTQVKLVTLGANDPEFSLRNEKAFILSHGNTVNHTFVAVTEAHGGTNPIAETTTGYTTNVNNITIVSDDANTTIFKVEVLKKTYTVRINYNDKSNFIHIEKQ